MDLIFYKGMLAINFINLKAGMVIMCNKEEMQELIQCFINLPDMYQQNILGIVRDKIQLYEMQTNVEQLRNGFVVGFRRLKVKTILKTKSYK